MAQVESGGAAAAEEAEGGVAPAPARAAAAELLRERVKTTGVALRTARAVGQDVRALLAELSLLQAEVEQAAAAAPLL